MRRLLFIEYFKIILLILVCISLSFDISAQCTNCGTNIIPINSTYFEVTGNNQTYCIQGPGTYSGTINFGSYTGITICIGSDVTVGASGGIFNPGNGTTVNTFVNHGTWNRDLKSIFAGGNTGFINFGIANTPVFNLTNYQVVENRGVLNITGEGKVIVNSGATFSTVDGSETNINGELTVPSGGTLSVGGVIKTTRLYINGGSNITGVAPACAGIDITTYFFNDNKAFSNNPGIYTNISPNDGNERTPSGITINTNPKPTISTQPEPAVLCENKSTSFNVAATGKNLQYQWQVKMSGLPGIFKNLANTAPYSGVNTPTLNISGAGFELNNAEYRVLVTDCPYQVVSNAAKLTVNVNPVISLVLDGPPIFCYKGQKAIKVTGTYNTFKWTKSPVPISDNLSSYIPQSGGLYEVTGYNDLKCFNSKSVQIQFDSTLSNFNLGPDQKVVCSTGPNSDPIVVPAGNYSQVSWQGSVETVPDKTMSYKPTKSGIYKVTVTANNANKCSLADSVNVAYRNGLDDFNLPAIFNPCKMGPDIVIPSSPYYNTITWKTPDNAVIPPKTDKYHPKVGGTYTITVSDGTCSKTSNVQVDFLDTLQANLGNASVVSCQDNRTQLKVIKGNFVYKWSLDGITVKDSTSSTFTPARQGRYKVQVYDPRYPECISKDSIDVVYSPDFAFNFNGDSTASCAGTNFKLCVSGGNSYTWKKGNEPLPEKTGCLAPTASGYYAVTVSDKNGCSKTKGIYVKHYEPINGGLNGKDTVSCFPYTIYTIKATKGPRYTYEWTPNVTTSNEYTPSLSGNDTIQKYKVKISNRDKCFVVDSVSVRFPKKIELNFSGDSTASCFGAGFNLCAKGGIRYDWTPAGAAPSNTQNCIAPTVSGTYGVKAVDKNGCVREASIYVKHYNKLDIGLNGKDTASCYPYNRYTIAVNLRGQNFKYEWSPNTSNTGPDYTPVFSGDTVQKFKVKVTNPDGCFDTDSITVRYVPEIQFPKIDGGDTTACEYFKYTISPGEGYGRYDWSIPDYHKSTYVPTKSGKYWVKVYTKRGGCSKTSDTVNVKFVPDIILDLGEGKTQCSYQGPTELDAGSGFESYIWENNPAFNKRTYKVPFPTFEGSGTKKDITVVGTYEKVCKATGKVTISFIKQGALSLGDETEYVCPGQPVTFEVPPVYDSYFWSSSQNPSVAISTTNKLTVQEQDTYTLGVFSSCGSEYIAKTIKHYDVPQVVFGNDTSIFGKEITICLGKSLVIKNHADLNNEKGYVYDWKEKGSDISYANKSVPFTVNIDGVYYATVKNKYNCISSDTIMVHTNGEGECFKIPNLITPNREDTINNTFHINGILNGTWSIKIYNRWGNKVYESEAYNNDWSAQDVGDGMYFYHLEYPAENKRYNGWIEVIGKSRN